jgi:hypothetical protein
MPEILVLIGLGWIALEGVLALTAPRWGREKIDDPE